MKNHEILEKNVGLLAIFMVIALGGGGVDHHHDRWRDEDAQGPGIADDPRAEGARIAGADHAGHGDRADRRHCRRRRTGQRGEQHAGKHRSDRQAAADMPDAGIGEVDQAPRHATGGHDCENHYIHSFELENGRIKRNREFMNPIQKLRALGIAVPQIKRDGIPT